MTHHHITAYSELSRVSPFKSSDVIYSIWIHQKPFLKPNTSLSPNNKVIRLLVHTTDSLLCTSCCLMLIVNPPKGAGALRASDIYEAIQDYFPFIYSQILLWYLQ
jgi:hypothetical protein